MDGWTRLRIITIIAVVLISIYVLMPSLVGIVEHDAHLGDKIENVEQPTEQVDHLKVPLDVISGELGELAPQIDARLRAAGVLIDQVQLDEDDWQLIVHLQAGATRDQVASVLAASHTISALDARPLGEEVALQALVGQEPPAGALPAEISELQAEAGSLATFKVALQVSEVEGLAPVLLVIDGKVDSIKEVDPHTGTAAVDLGEGRDLFLASVLHPIDGQVSVRELATQPVAEEQVQEEVPEYVPVVPEWFTSILPDTALNLGLDLQGGIDLTLQVELDEAVLSKVARDMTSFEDAAAHEDIELTQVKRDRVEPQIMVTSSAELADIQSFVHKRMPDYIYYDSVTEGPETFHAFRMTDTAIKRVQDQAVEQVLETLRARVDETGVKEPSIVKKGGGRINVQLPGEVDLQAALDAIGTTAVLEFRLVDEEFDEAELQRMVAAARDTLPSEQFDDDDLLNSWLWNSGRLQDDRIVLWQYEEVVSEDGASSDLVRDYAVALKGEVMLTGDDINDASTGFDQNNQPIVTMQFKPQGGNTFCRVTGENVNKRFAIILDGKIRSAPNIQERICGGSARITMRESLDALQEANTLALVLRTGSLNAPVSVGEVRLIGPSLGKDAIQAGSIATLIGGLVVFIFMGVWYRTAGLVADIALAVNILMVMGLLALFGATLTLPGFAGLALTIGMAVDANIIIYERIREELRLGQMARKAVDVGFDKAAVAVLDANITTAIAGIVLFSYGTGPIKGFAVTLLIGIGTTLFTALFVARTIMELITRSSTARLRI